MPGEHCPAFGDLYAAIGLAVTTTAKNRARIKSDTIAIAQCSRPWPSLYYDNAVHICYSSLTPETQLTLLPLTITRWWWLGMTPTILWPWCWRSLQPQQHPMWPKFVGTIGTLHNSVTHSKIPPDIFDWRQPIDPSLAEELLWLPTKVTSGCGYLCV